MSDKGTEILGHFIPLLNYCFSFVPVYFFFPIWLFSYPAFPSFTVLNILVFLGHKLGLSRSCNFGGGIGITAKEKKTRKEQTFLYTLRQSLRNDICRIPTSLRMEQLI